ncbi:MATE family efflux transporter [Caulobacter sp. CCUG 60055]|uniref:MATE family efflux transporter n=1 Tax=Caulobacter sp. CCUG 60055 TaxID=2100090 RepID=UPI001FA80CAC|nr:MATE family efflux transporter [Caulobacter sp. CCUG 60055]
MSQGPETAAALRRSILAIALPSMLTNVATALFGLADMWVIGRLGDAAAQGGVEVGAKLLMTLLIVFNFLRSGTVALTAQAAGRDDPDAQAAALTRGLAAALAVGALLLLARPLLVPLGLHLLGAGGKVAELARLYVDIRYWSALAWLANCVLTGWLIGRRSVRAVLAVEVGANLVHIALDLALVLGLGLGVAGVAAATLLSEALKLLALAAMAAREGPARRALALVREPATWRAPALAALFRLNRDLFGRTLLLMSATVLLTRAGAEQGATILAANAILYQLFMLSALLLDGFESAAQVLCGEALGAGDRARFGRTVRAVLVWSGLAAAVIAAGYLLGGPRLAASFSTDPAVTAAARAYVGWAVLLPLLGVASFVYDGVFIGSSWTRAMLLSMAAALAAFVVALFAARPLGNHGVWLAFSLFFLARTAGQAWLTPRLTRRTFRPDAPVPA